LSEETAMISLNRINWLGFVMQTQYVSYDVGIEYSNITQKKFVLQIVEYAGYILAYCMNREASGDNPSVYYYILGFCNLLQPRYGPEIARKVLKLPLLMLRCSLNACWSIDMPTMIFSCSNRVRYKNKSLWAFELIAYQF
jgi:hypothetical protein